MPPYKEDFYTWNHPVGSHLVNASHHQAAAREKKVRCYGIGFGFTEATANIIWAVNKVLDSDCHFSTLKPRLGLPDSILEQLPEEEDIIGTAYTFEAEHPELFDAEQFGQVGVYFSYETRNHTCFGNLAAGYSADYFDTLKALFRAGISAHTLFHLPEDATYYPFVIIPSPASMTAKEIAEVERYVANGGRVAITGPSAYPGCGAHWVLPTQPQVQPQDFFRSSDGIRIYAAPWVSDMKLSPCKEPNRWSEIEEQIYYNPHRVSDGQITTSLLELCRTYGQKTPVTVEQAKGYFITTFTGEQGTIVHLLAEDYHTDIDHHLDEIRFHRSRVNFINKVEPIGVSREIVLDAVQAPLVYTPFNDEPSKVDMSENGCTVTLPEACSYAILWFRK